MARVGVAAGTATAVSNRVSRRQGRRWQHQDEQAAQSQQQYAPPPPPPPPAAPASSTGSPDAVSAELERIAGLKNQGLLTDEEFAAAKAKVLGI
jgi:hypothetical protein